MAEPTRNRDLDDAIASLRRFLRARWEERDDVLFRTTAPLPLVPPVAARPGLRTPTPPQGVLRAATPAARPAYPAPAFRTAPPLPRPLAARPGGGRASVERHESGILNPNGSDRAKALLELYERIKTC